MVPVISIVGVPNSGKTFFIEELTKELRSRDHKIGTLKHTSHDFKSDIPGKDSYRLKESGSSIGGIFSEGSISITRDLNGDEDFSRIVEDYYFEMDILLVEGYKKGRFPKILIMAGRDIEKELEEFKKEEVIAVVGEGEPDTELNHFGKNEIKGVADFLEKELIKPYQQQEIDLFVNGRPVILKEYVQKVTKNILGGIINSLKGIEEEIEDIGLRYKKKGK